MARRRGAVARLMLRDVARTLRRRAAPAAPGSVGELVFSGTAPAGADRCRDVRPRGPGRPAPHRVLRPAPHGRALADRAEGHAAPAGLSPRGVRARQQRRVPPGGVPGCVPRAGVADRAARSGARRLRPGAPYPRRSARVHGDARGRRAPARTCTSPDVVRNEPLREPWCAHVARRARGIIVHSAFCKAIPRGGRLPHAGLRRAAPGRGVGWRHAQGRRSRTTSCARRLEPNAACARSSWRPAI